MDCLISPQSFPNLDFADDVALLLETMALKPTSLELNWQKTTKVQALGKQGGRTINNHSSRTGGCRS